MADDKRRTAICRLSSVVAFAMNVVLISTYELGRQPFGVASPAAWLKQAGAHITCLDLSIQQLDADALGAAGLVAFYLPMHTATRIAAPLITRVKRIASRAHVVCYGLYAPVNENYLRALGADTILGGEFETALAETYEQLKRMQHAEPAGPAGCNVWGEGRGQISTTHASTGTPVLSRVNIQSNISLARQQFLIPDRTGLPKLSKYAKLIRNGDKPRVTGYTEASRGCKHWCRHCPIVPVYNGRFFVVQPEVVLADIRQQVALGARHITFGDPDFFNGPRHAIQIVEQLHREFPSVTYDVTVKVEQLLQHANLLPTLRDSGCAFVTSAVEAVDDRILEIFDKQHTRADFIRVVERFRELGLTLNPTFVTFNPWITLAGYRDLLALLIELDLIDNVAPIQLAIRLLIPRGSRLLELPEVQSLVGAFDDAALCYAWRHPDPRVDELHARVLQVVKAGEANGDTRRAIFGQVWRLAHDALGRDVDRWRETTFALAAKPIPHLSEPWYC